MGGFTTSDPNGDGEQQITLSTGETVTVPLATSASIVGSVVPAARETVASQLPEGLAPLQLGPDSAAVTFLAVSYDRIGEGAMAPYDEFAVLFPAVEDDTETLAGLLSRGIGGYVWYMPVTTASGRALGAEVWGYPKVVADIDLVDADGTRRASVTVDGEDVITVELDRGPAVQTRTTGHTYSVKHGGLLREEFVMRGDVGVWPTTSDITYEFGDHRRATTLRSLALGDRAILTLTADCEFVIHPGEPVG